MGSPPLRLRQRPVVEGRGLANVEAALAPALTCHRYWPMGEVSVGAVTRQWLTVGD